MQKINVLDHLALLGHKVKDKVTEQQGVATSIGFDLYGCVQVIVHPGVDKDGKPKEPLWFDIARLDKVSTTPVMLPPDFVLGEAAAGDRGPAEKPRSHKF